MSLIGRGRGWGGRLFEAGRLLTFSAFRMGAYSRWALIRGWALIRLNTVNREELPTPSYELLKLETLSSLPLLGMSQVTSPYLGRAMLLPHLLSGHHPC